MLGDGAVSSVGLMDWMGVSNVALFARHGKNCGGGVLELAELVSY